MNTPDLINSLFEFGGCIMAIVNTIKLQRDKDVKGVYWPFTVFLSIWGYFNIYYYWHLEQWMSLVAGGTLSVFNTVWVILAIYYVELKLHLKDSHDG